MATNETLKGALASKNEQKTKVNPNDLPVKELLNSISFKKRFEEILDKRAPQFMASIVNLVNSDANLQQCQPVSVIQACAMAATMNLPIDKNLGYAWIVPYKNKATFQIGYKGYIQLALRSGQYRAINVIDVHEGELIEWNPLTEEFNIDFKQKTSDAVIGYAGYFELLNGFRKAVYWSKEDIQAHRRRFSKTKSGGVWDTDFDAMARKTVIRNMLSKWGILSIDMQMAESLETKQEDDTAQEPVLVNPETGEVIDIDANELLGQAQENEQANDLLNKEITLTELE